MRIVFKFIALLALFQVLSFGAAPVITNTMSLQELNKLTANGGMADDYFGYSVAIDGDTAVVGAKEDDCLNGDDKCGSAYIFERDPSTGFFIQSARLSASDGNGSIVTGDYFGYSVSISGDTVVVGAERAGIGGQVYIFNKPVSGWSDITENEILVASEPEEFDYFGHSVSISDNAIVVGMKGDSCTNGDSACGSAIIFERNTVTDPFVEFAKLTSSDAQENDNFGVAVAISGNTVVVGAEYADEIFSISGAAYIFEKPGSVWVTTAIQNGKITASDAEASAYFGCSVAIDADTIVVGAHNHGDYNNGAAYIFEKPDLGWDTAIEDAKLTASGADTAFNNFGYSVSISDSRIIIGAYRIDLAYSFEKPASGWITTTESSKLIASDRAIGDDFGWSVSISGDTVIVGAFQDDDKGSNSGSAYMFKVKDYAFNTPENQQSAIDIDATDSDGNPITYAIIDGVDAALFSIDTQNGLITFNTVPDYEAPHDSDADNIYELTIQVVDSNDDNSSGSFLIRVSDIEYEGPAIKAMSFKELQKLKDASGTDDDNFGRSVAISSDTAVIGSPNHNGTGIAYVLEYNTDSKLFEVVAELTSTNLTSDDYFGYSVAISDDTIVVGAYNDGEFIEGKAYIFERPPSGWVNMTQTAMFYASDLIIEHKFGYSVSISGDTVIVGAYLDDDGGTSSGAAYIFEKPVSGVWSTTSQNAKLTASDAAVSDYFAQSVAISGNTVVVGAYGDDDSGLDSGSAYIFEKPLSQWSDMNQTAKLTADDSESRDYFGKSVAISGKIVVIGAYGDDNGSAYIFEKPLSEWADMTQTAKLTPGDAAGANWSGYSVSISGETVVIGAYSDDDKAINAGAAYLFDKPNSGWVDMHESAKITASDAQASDNFGQSVAISGDTIIVGAHMDDDNGADSGSAYIFKGSSSSGMSPALIMYLLN